MYFIYPIIVQTTITKALNRHMHFEMALFTTQGTTEIMVIDDRKIQFRTTSQYFQSSDFIGYLKGRFFKIVLNKRLKNQHIDNTLRYNKILVTVLNMILVFFFSRRLVSCSHFYDIFPPLDKDLCIKT